MAADAAPGVHPALTLLVLILGLALYLFYRYGCARPGTKGGRKGRPAQRRSRRRFFRYGAIYLIPSHHPLKGKVVCGYIGKTRQYPPRQRVDQHLKGSARYGHGPKPWADTYSPAHPYRLLFEGNVSNLGLHLREWFYIQIRWPLYNDKMNRRRNPRRIRKEVFIRQRAERDAGIYTWPYARHALGWSKEQWRTRQVGSGGLRRIAV